MKGRRGLVALTSILIIGALVLVISVGVALRSIGETDMSLSEETAHRALSLANLCAEQAVMKLESVLAYGGNESIIVGEDSCEILPVAGCGERYRTVKTQSTVAGYTKKVKVEVLQVSPTMQITSWEEVADF